MTKVLIPIERLIHETWIAAPSGPARAIAITFDGSGYGIDLRYGESDDGYEEYLYVDAGGSVEFAGVGEPRMLDEKFVTADEWEAKTAANDAATEAMLGKIAALHADTAEMQAEMFGVPALVAAE